MLLLAESRWRHCSNGLLLLTATGNVVERRPGPAVIRFLAIDML